MAGRNLFADETPPGRNLPSDTDAGQALMTTAEMGIEKPGGGDLPLDVRFGHGMVRGAQGLKQGLMMGTEAAMSGLEKLTPGHIPPYEPFETAADYTKSIAPEEAIYQAGRGKQAGTLDVPSMIGEASYEAVPAIVTGLGSLAKTVPEHAGKIMRFMKSMGWGVAGGAAGGAAAFTPAEEGEEDWDLWLDKGKQTAMGAGLGAAAAPVVGMVGMAAKQANKAVRAMASNVQVSGEKLASTIDPLLSKYAMKWDGLHPDTRSMLRREAALQIRQGGEIDPQILMQRAALADMGMKPTVGQAQQAGDLMRAEAASARGGAPEVQKAFSQQLEGNAEAAIAESGKIEAALGGRAATDPGAAVKYFKVAKANERRVQESVSKLYDQAMENYGQLPAKLDNTITHIEGMLDIAESPEKIQAFLNYAKKFQDSPTVEAAHNIRKELNKRLRSTNDPDTWRRLNSARKVLDGDVFDALPDDGFRAAFQAAADKANAFNDNVLSKVVGFRKDPNTKTFVKNVIMGGEPKQVGSLKAALLNPPTSLSGPERAAALADGQAAWDAVRGRVWKNFADESMAVNSAGRATLKGAGISAALDKTDPTILRMLFSREELAGMRKLADGTSWLLETAPYASGADVGTGAQLMNHIKNAGMTMSTVSVGGQAYRPLGVAKEASEVVGRVMGLKEARKSLAGSGTGLRMPPPKLRGAGAASAAAGTTTEEAGDYPNYLIDRYKKFTGN